jgi:hypothetical protein
MAKNAREKVERLLPILREDYRRKTGKPFEHFYCPMLLRDEKTELCMADIVNQAIKGSFGDWVVQRKDVDGFYGAMFEADFTTLVMAQESGEALFDDNLRKKMPTRVTVDGVECPHHELRGKYVAPHHSVIAVGDANRRGVYLVIHKSPEEMRTLKNAKWQIETGQDYSLSGLVSTIKAGFLTMFRLLRYQSALASDGLEVGRSILGKFFEENATLPKQEVRRNGVAFSQRYVNMARPIDDYTGAPPLGTVEDHRAQLCVTRGNKHFAIIVCVRAAGRCYAVLLPYFYDVEAAVAYQDFMTNDNQRLQTHHCIFDVKTKSFKAQEEPTETHWPKSPDNVLCE